MGIQEGDDRTQPVDQHRAAARDEIDDGVGDAQLGRNFDGSAKLDDGNVYLVTGEEVLCSPPVRGSDSKACEVLHLIDLGISGDCRYEPAPPEAELS